MENKNNAMSREKIMDTSLKPLKDKYDFILIDCMPSLGMITLNVLTAAEAAGKGQSIFAYDKGGKAAKAYECLVKEVISNVERKKKRDKASVTR